MNNTIAVNDFDAYEKDPVIKSLNDMAARLNSLSLPISIEYKDGELKYTYPDLYYRTMHSINKARTERIKQYHTLKGESNGYRQDEVI